MVDVKVARTVENPNLTPDQWDLFTFEAKLAQRCARAAQRLNEVFTESVNAGMTRDEVRSEVNKIQTMFANSGSDDTEPHAVLEGLLDKVYGPE